MDTGSKGLLEAVRRKLNISWEDPQTDARVRDIIADAIPTMIHKLGITDNAYGFVTPGMERKLFLEYCRHEWNDEAKLFDTNYANDILQVRAKWSQINS